MEAAAENLCELPYVGIYIESRLDMEQCYSCAESYNSQLILRYVQSLCFHPRFVHAVADLSINELKVHFLGSTKFAPDDPYMELHTILLKRTKYTQEGDWIGSFTKDWQRRYPSWNTDEH